GLMMPSAPWVTATCCHSSLTRASTEPSAPCLSRRGVTRHGQQEGESSLITVNQRYQLPANFLDRCVHQRDVELAGRGELLLRHGQAALHDVGRLGTAA